jgi:aspartate dehydrogenase
LLVISVGALAEPKLLQALKTAAHDGGSRILLPAGAIGGIDAIAAMRLSGLIMVRYRSRKPPAAWRGSPAEKVADLDSLTSRTVLYRGTAGEAALLYPQNANVAAAVALAGLGFDATEVELVADPEAPGNVHEIEAEGTAGRFAIQLQGKPSRTNPKTSALAALSVARALINLDATIVI